MINLRQEPIAVILPYLESGLGFRLRRRRGAGARRNRDPTALVAPSNYQNLTARWTRGVRSEPGVDTANMESMSALRQHSDFVSGGELREADRAIGELTCGFGCGGELGEGAEDLFLDAFVGSSGRRLWSGGRGEAEAAETAAARDGDEAEDADECAEEGGEDDDEVGVDNGGVVGRVALA